MSFVFLRHHRSATPRGCIAFNVDKTGRKVSFQLSVLNEKKYWIDAKDIRFIVDGKEVVKTHRRRLVRDVFNRQVARETASEKLNSNPITIELTRDRMSHFDVQHAIMSAIYTNTSLPNRAQRVARDWLDLNILYKNAVNNPNLTRKTCPGYLY